MHLVQQLLAQGVEIDTPTSARRFADDSIAILPHFGDGITDVGKVRDGAPIATEISASCLPAAL